MNLGIVTRVGNGHRNIKRLIFHQPSPTGLATTTDPNRHCKHCSRISNDNCKIKQAISVCEQALCQLTVCFEFQVEVTEEKDTKVVA